MYTTVDNTDMNRKVKIVSIELDTEANNICRLRMIFCTTAAVQEITTLYDAIFTTKIIPNKNWTLRL